MSLSPRIGRLVALSLALALLVAFWSTLLSPAIDQIATNRTRIAATRTLLARYGRLAAAVPRLRQRVAALTAGPSPSGFLGGTSEVLAATKLQATLQAMTAHAGVILRSSQTLPADTEGPVTRIGLDLQIGADPASLRDLLHAIEGAAPALFVDRLSVQAPEAPIPADATPRRMLNIRLQLHGYLQGTGS